MNTVTIPRTLAKNDDLVVVPRREYERLLSGLRSSKINRQRETGPFRSTQESRRCMEESDTDLAIKIYKEEKKKGKLKVLNSLANLM